MPLSGIETTLRTLLRSPNPAATDLLVVALWADNAALRVGAVRALALREDPAGHRALVERLHRLPPDAVAALSDVSTEAPLADSLAAMINPATPQLARRAVEVAASWEATSVLPAAVEAAQWPGDYGPAFAADVVRMSERLEAEVVAYDPRVAAQGEGMRDPAFRRRAAVNALSNALLRYDQHGRPELIEALLMLTPPGEPALMRVLNHPEEAAHEPLVAALRTSRRLGAIGLLAAVLNDPRAPQALLDLVAERTDAAALTLLFERVGSPVSLRVRETCQRIDSFAWLDPARMPVLLELPPLPQAVAVQLAAASKASRRRLREAVLLLLDGGAAEGRLAAARAIEAVPTHLAVEPLQAALESADPEVVAVAASLLRKKEYPDATGTLVRLLDAADSRVRTAAQRGLRGLSFAAYRDQVDELPEEQRGRVGQIVSKADPMTVPSLTSELGSGAVARRLAALDLIETMGLQGSLVGELVERIGDVDAGVRAEAARLLGDAEATPPTLEALETAQSDRSPAVRRAAERSLQRLTGEPSPTLEGVE